MGVTCFMASTKIRLNNGVIRHNLLRGTPRQYSTFGHDDDRITQFADELHVMFDHAEGVPLFLIESQDGISNSVEERSVYAGTYFVEKDDLGLPPHG